MLDPRFFSNRRFSLGSATITTSFLAMFGFFFIVTQYFQFAQGHSPLAAALRMLPFALTMIVVAPRSAGLAERFGSRTMVALGLAIAGLGLALFGLLEVNTHYAIIVLPLIMIAVGLATLMPPSTEAIVSSLPQDKAGVGSAVNDTTREVGGAIGIALMGSLLVSGYRSAVSDSLTGLPPELADVASESVGGALAVAGQVDPGLGAELAPPPPKHSPMACRSPSGREPPSCWPWRPPTGLPLPDTCRFRKPRTRQASTNHPFRAGSQARSGRPAGGSSMGTSTEAIRDLHEPRGTS